MPLAFPGYFNGLGHLGELNFDKEGKDLFFVPKWLKKVPFATSAAATISSTVVAAKPRRAKSFNAAR